ncbi:MAG: hypothetical protein ACFE78_13195 [Candidatus Hodarchaeota archaeon]
MVVIIPGPIYFLMGYVLIWAAPIIALVYGIVGLVKDHKIPMAIIGLNFTMAFYIIFLTRFIQVTVF